MLKKPLFIAITACALITHLPAQIIAQWNFDTLAVPTTQGTTPPTPTAGSYLADVGSGTLTALHASASTVWSTPGGNGSPKSFSSNQWAVGDYYQFQVSTVGFSNINIGFMQTSSNTGPSSFTLQYSTDGTSFTDFITYSVPANAGSPPTTIAWSANSYKPESTLYFDLSSITAIDGLAAVYFRISDASTTAINGGTVASTGTGRVDQFTVSQGFVDIAPVPEPGTVALVAIGLGAILFGARRRCA